MGFRRLFCLLLPLAFACEDSTAPPVPPAPELSAAMVMPPALGEVFLRIRGDHLPDGTRFYLFRSDSFLHQGPFHSRDTTVLDIGLEPATEYAYRVLLADIEGRTVIEDTVFARTLDTTEHATQWTRYTLGEVGFSGLFRDVAIRAPDDIWAVGQVEVGVDSNGAPIRYNAAHWDGTAWELRQIPMRLSRNSSRTDFVDLNGVWPLAPDDIWVTSGWQVAHFDGQEWGEWDILFDSLGDPTYGSMIRVNSDAAGACGERDDGPTSTVSGKNAGGAPSSIPPIWNWRASGSAPTARKPGPPRPRVPTGPTSSRIATASGPACTTPRPTGSANSRFVKAAFPDTSGPGCVFRATISSSPTLPASIACPAIPAARSAAMVFPKSSGRR